MTHGPINWITVGGSDNNAETRCLDARYLDHGVDELDVQIQLAYDAGYRRMVIDSWFGFHDGKHKPFSARREMTRENTGHQYDRMLDVQSLTRVLRYWSLVRRCEVIWYPGKIMADPTLTRLQRPTFFDNWFSELRYDMYPALNSGCSVALDAVYGNGPGDPVTHVAGLLRSLGITVYTEPFPHPDTPQPPGGDYPAIAMMDRYLSYKGRHDNPKPDSPQHSRLAKAENIVITKTRNSDFAATIAQAKAIIDAGHTPAVDTWRVMVSDILEPTP